MIKSIISFIISLIMTISPFSIVLSNNVDNNDVGIKNENYSVNGNTSFGNIFAEAMNDYSNKNTVENDYCVKDVTISDNTILVDMKNKTECSLLVGIYDEETFELIETANKKVSASEDQIVDVQINGDLPESYIVKAVAVDNNNQNLCNVYTDNDNAEWYKEFMDSTIYDYKGNDVINLDNSANDNFAVFNDDVIVIPDETTTLIASENNSYLLSKDSCTQNLNTGDIIAYNIGDSENAVIGKIENISKKSDNIVVKLTSPELEEAFDVVKIHFDEKEATMYNESNVIDSSEEIVTSSFDEPIFVTNSIGSGTISGSGSTSTVLGFKYGSLTLSIGASATFEYDVWRGYARVSVSVSPSAKLHISIGFSTTKEFNLGNIYIPVVAGVDITVPITVVMRLSASITFDTTITDTVGFSWSTSNGIQNISKQAVVDSQLQIEGTFYVGIRVTPTINLLWGVCQGGISGEAGAQLRATAGWHYSNIQTERHDCGLACIHCGVDVLMSVKASLKISVIGWTPVDKTWDLWNAKFNDVMCFHYSIKYHEFGWGPCEHISYYTTFEVVDKNGKPIRNAKIDGVTTDNKGIAKIWYTEGKHTIVVRASGYCSQNYRLAVTSAVKYTIRLNEGSPDIFEEITDGSYFTWKKKIYSYGYGGFSNYYVAPLQYIEPLTGTVLSTAVSGQRRNDTAWVQRELKKLGYYSSEPDGYYGYSTAEAVRKFQADYDLPVTGQVNRNVVEVIKKPLKKVSAPNLKLTSSANITNGEIVSVSWDSVSGASEYNVYVYNTKGEMVANAIGTKATNAAFVLYEKGTYTIKAESKNDRFTSEMSTLGTVITVTDPLLITFENSDGTVLCKQYVAYGAAATAPAAPEMEGYTFSKWDTDFSKVTQDGLIVKPIFTRNQYTVKFLNADGSEIVTENNKYYYGESAVAPSEASVNVLTGYKFVGWDKDFSFIYENLTVKPVIVWENDDIPIQIDDCSATKDEGYGYTVNVTLRNFEKQRTNGRVVVALKTTDEKFITMTESSAFTLKKSDIKNNVISKETMEIFVPCKSDVTYADVFVVDNYDDLIPISDTYRVTLKENNEGLNNSEVKVFSGNVDPCLSGKRAILFIYKIGDASDFTNEFIGQTVIDSNGNYSFDYNLREIPSIETGDFYVVLGIEGAKNSIFLNKIEAPKPIYTVTFKDFDGSIIKTEQVVQGEHAELPENNPERPGYIFAGWDYTNSAIYEDLTITAIYAHKIYTVIFIDWTNKRFDAQTYYYGEPLRTPDLSTLDDYDAIGWENAVEGMPVTQNMVITAKYKKKVFTVNFYDNKGNIIDTQFVEYGESATEPELKDISYNFYGWDNESFNFVTCSMDIKPCFSYTEDTATPFANIDSGIYSDDITIMLNCSDEADIYYSINGSDFILYTKPFVISESSAIEYYASSFGKNISDTVSNYYIINKSGQESEWKVPVTVYKDNTPIGVYMVKYGSKVSENNLYAEEYGYNFIGFSLNDSLAEVVPDNYSFVSPTKLYVKNEAKKFTVVFKDNNENIISVQEVAYMEAAEEPEVIIEQPDLIFTGWDSDDFLCVTKDIEVHVVTVNQKDYLAIKLNRDSYTMMEGYTYNLSATINGETDAELFWTSSNDNIAIVDENGKVTAISDGVAVITATLLGTDVSETCFITIIKNPDMSLTLKDDSKYTEYEGYICGVSPSNNTVSFVKSEIATEKNIKFFSGDKELSDSDIVSTGTTVNMYDNDNNKIDSLIIVVIGDVDGDGEANLPDASHISCYLINKETLDEISLLAADVNGDGVVNNIDASMIMRYQAEKENI